MTKFVFLLLGVLSIISLSSCKKTYSCTCTTYTEYIHSSGEIEQIKSTQIYTYKTRKKDTAKTTCNKEHAQTYPAGNTTCDIQ